MKPKGKSYLRRMFSSSGRNQKREALPAARAGSEGHTADISYAAEAFVFDMQELLLRQLHVQEVLEHQPVPEHGTLQGKRITLKKKKNNSNGANEGARACGWQADLLCFSQSEESCGERRSEERQAAVTPVLPWNTNKQQKRGSARLSAHLSLVISGRRSSTHTHTHT